MTTLPRMSRPPDEALALNIMACPTLIISTQLSASSVISPVSDGLLGKASSKMYKNTGIKTDVYTVFAPNSRPTKRKPITKHSTFKIKVITEICTGIKCTKIIARPVILPKIMFPGIIKK